MTCSPARLAANQKNSLKSTGPRTEAGKLASRANSFKHGLTGSGVVIPGEDENAVAALAAEFHADFRPTTAYGSRLLRRAALLAVRTDRCAAKEEADIARDVRNAPRDFDDARKLQVEHAVSWLAAEPATHARRLRSTPEGVDRMLRAWLDLGTDLDHRDGPRWEFGHYQRMENLMGRKPSDFPYSLAASYNDAFHGRRDTLDEGEADGMDDRALKEYARLKLADIIIAQIKELTKLRATMSDAITDLDRAEAGQRALFNPSKEATLARKYELAAERGMYKAMDEFRQVEAEADAARQGQEPPRRRATLGSLASFFRADSPGPANPDEAQEFAAWPDPTGLDGPSTAPGSAEVGPESDRFGVGRPS